MPKVTEAVVVQVVIARTEVEAPRAVREILEERTRPVEAVGAHVVEAATAAAARSRKEIELPLGPVTL